MPRDNYFNCIFITKLLNVLVPCLNMVLVDDSVSGPIPIPVEMLCTGLDSRKFRYSV